MKNFTYYRPTTPEQAVGLLEPRWGKSELLAGGTDLLDLQKEYVAQPDKVISLSGLGEAFRKITVTQPPGSSSAVINLGGGVTLAEIASHPDVRKHYPALSGAAGIIGGPQIRNMGTLGGNLCQRNRCWYFRDEHVNCLLKGGDKCFALDGENRYHAIFHPNGGKCVIVHPSTLAPALIAIGATAKVLGPQGARDVKLTEFFRAPSAASEREHVLEPNEIVLSVTVSGGQEDQRARFHNASYEVRHKQSYDWPLVQAAVSFLASDGKVKSPRIVLGHVAPTPHVAAGVAKVLEGKEVTEETAQAAGEAAAEGAKPLSQNAYKVKLVAVAVKRALLTAAGQKKYWEV